MVGHHENCSRKHGSRWTQAGHRMAEKSCLDEFRRLGNRLKRWPFRLLISVRSRFLRFLNQIASTRPAGLLMGGTWQLLLRIPVGLCFTTLRSKNGTTGLMELERFRLLAGQAMANTFITTAPQRALLRTVVPKSVRSSLNWLSI